MRNRDLRICSMLIIGTALMAQFARASVSSHPGGDQPAYVPDRVVVRFEPLPKGEPAAKRPQIANVKKMRCLLRPSRFRACDPTVDGPHQVHILDFHRGQDVPALADQLSKLPGVRYAYPDYIMRIAETLPNDPDFSELWGLHNTGQSGGTIDADIDAPDAWDISTGSAGIIVGVIDSGVDYTHPDLAANMWVNAGESGGGKETDGIDNDGNGYVDDVYGYDFLSDDGDPMDAHSHGTHVAGTIAAVGNNGIGVVGVNWTAKIMALRFLGAGGSGPTSLGTEALYYAIDNGAHLTNNSYGGGGFTQDMEDALTASLAAGMPFIAAAGNDSRDIDGGQPYYPAGYAVDSVITVASTDRNDARSSFSNWGAVSVDLGAPGSSVWSTEPPLVDTILENFSGTTPPAIPPTFTLEGPANFWGTEDSGTNIRAQGDWANSYPYASNADGSIVTQPMDTTGIPGLSLSFSYRYEIGTGDAFTVDVWDGAAWIEILRRSDANQFNPFFFSSRLDLDPYRNTDMKFRFRWQTDDVDNNYFGVEIDNISLRQVGSDYTNAYGTKSGTSMATPHVAGSTALLLANDPTLCLPALRQLINTTGDAIPALDGITVSGRRLNVHSALTTTPTPTVTVTVPNGPEKWLQGQLVNIVWSSFACDTVDIELIKGGVVHSQIATGITNSGQFPWLIPGVVPAGSDYKVRVSAGPNTDESDAEFTITVPNVIFVDASASGLGTGLSWDDAYTDLQSALSIALPSDQVWVAAGVYRPSLEAEPGDPRSATFAVPFGVSIYGGFDGTEVVITEADPSVNITTLSGDLNGNDGPSFANNDENAYHVLNTSGVDETTILDGLVITAGHADAPETFNEDAGAGIYSASGSPTINRCTIIRNHGQRGAGMFLQTGTPILVNTAFIENVSTNCGGAMYNINSAQPELRNCLVLGNSAPCGAGLYNTGFTNVTMHGCTVVRNVNTSSNNGAGLVGFNAATVTNSIFWQNEVSGVTDELAQIDGAAAVTYSCIQGLNVLAGIGNIGTDPLFLDPIGPDSIPGTADDDFRLLPLSPCIDAGDNTAVPTDETDLDADGNVAERHPLDLRSEPRFFDVTSVADTGVADPPSYPDVVDMGAFEAQFIPVPPILLVDDDAVGAGNGTSWSDAVADLQEALTIAVNAGTVTEIWVAQGTYRPDQGTGDRTATFQLLSGVKLYGGFDGTEASLDDRAGLFTETILSGDLLGDDGPGFGNIAENSYHVVNAGLTDTTALLDGFTVSGGNADGTGEVKGGGLVNVDGHAMIRNCTFTGNSAHIGGGLYAEGSDSFIVRCDFNDNQADPDAGGSLGAGGGLTWWSGDPLILNCSFTHNFTGGVGGGLSVGHVGSNAVLFNCQISHNTAANGGGGMWMGSGTATISNCTFARNMASGVFDGGGLYDQAFGGEGPCLISSCIFWDNVDTGGMDETGQITGQAPNIAYSCVEGLTGALGGIGNIDQDPMFADPDNDLRLHPGSPCIDAGNNLATIIDVADLDGDGDIFELTPFDLADDVRFFDDFCTPDTGNGTAPIIDMGAYEASPSYAGNAILFVDQNVVGGTGAGSTWANAFRELHTAICIAEFGLFTTEIWVAQGTYTPQGLDRGNSFELLDGITLYGGFPSGGGDGTFGARNPGAFPTVLSGDLNGDDSPGFLNNSDNSYHVVIANGVDATAQIDGFVVSGGNANLTGLEVDGGGLVIRNASPTVRYCTFNGNWAKNGGGLAADAGSIPFIANCTFEENAAGGLGGGLYFIGAGCKPELVTCLLNGNTAVSGGGGMYAEVGAEPTVITSTVVHNSSAASGGGIGVVTGGLVVRNSILWQNSDLSGIGQSSQVFTFGFLPDVNYSCVMGLSGSLPGLGNIGDDPRFVDANGLDGVHGTADDDLHLSLNSPCIEAGDPAFVIDSAAPYDNDGDRRVRACHVDMGVDEFAAGVAGSGDLNHSATTDIVDVPLFVSELLSPTPLGRCLGDINDDGRLDGDDIQLFLDIVLAGP